MPEIKVTPEGQCDPKCCLFQWKDNSQGHEGYPCFTKQTCVIGAGQTDEFGRQSPTSDCPGPGPLEVRSRLTKADAVADVLDAVLREIEGWNEEYYGPNACECVDGSCTHCTRRKVLASYREDS